MDPFAQRPADELLEPPVPRPGFSVTPPPAELPGFDPSLSPLASGGAPDAPVPLQAGARLVGLTKPWLPNEPRVVYRVRREGWVSRREHARSRFGTITRQVGTSSNRVLAGLAERKGGVLGRSKSQATRPRLNLRGSLRGRGRGL